MEQAQLPGHPAKGISLVSLSVLLERLGYYGMRSFLILFFVQTLEFPKSKAADWYGLFTGAIYVSAFIGALLGDFLIGAPLAIIIGGILEAAGCFCLALSGTNSAIAGMILIVLGSGLFKPNIFQQVSSLYKSRVRYMDAGFSIFYFAINVGAFLGPFLGLFADNKETPNFSLGFILMGAAAIISILPIALDYKSHCNVFLEKKKSKTNVSASSIITLISVLLLLPLFWAIYEIIGNLTFSNTSSNQLTAIITSIILAGPVSVVLWSFVKLDSAYKVSMGFLILIIPLVIVAFVSPLIKNAQFVLAISEMLIAIPAYSIISRFAPPKLTGLFFCNKFWINPLYVQADLLV